MYLLGSCRAHVAQEIADRHMLRIGVAGMFDKHLAQRALARRRGAWQPSALASVLYMDCGGLQGSKAGNLPRTATIAKGLDMAFDSAVY
jgi:hypothetical protein